MRIVPVIDIWHGVVVRGVGGQREHYRPLEPLCEPLTVARMLIERAQARELYVADLGAIVDAQPDRDILPRLAALAVDRWIDAGLRVADDAQPLLDAGVEGIVAGLETLHGFGELERLLTNCGSERVVFSLDLRDGRAIMNCDHWPTIAPWELVDRAVSLGVRRLIVLDLARVGVGRGTGTESLCRAVTEQHPGVEVIAGGGIRGTDDLQRLTVAGASAALMASALHAGWWRESPSRRAGDVSPRILGLDKESGD